MKHFHLLSSEVEIVCVGGGVNSFSALLMEQALLYSPVSFQVLLC